MSERQRPYQPDSPKTANLIDLESRRRLPDPILPISFTQDFCDKALPVIAPLLEHQISVGVRDEEGKIVEREGVIIGADPILELMSVLVLGKLNRNETVDLNLSRIRTIALVHQAYAEAEQLTGEQIGDNLQVFDELIRHYREQNPVQEEPLGRKERLQLYLEETIAKISQ